LGNFKMGRKAFWEAGIGRNDEGNVICLGNRNGEIALSAHFKIPMALMFEVLYLFWAFIFVPQRDFRTAISRSIIDQQQLPAIHRLSQDAFNCLSNKALAIQKYGNY